MPIYEFRCNRCNRKSSHLFRGFSDAKTPVCPNCLSQDMRRVMSTFRVHVPWYSGMNLPSSESLTDFDEDDPKSMSKWVEGMRRDLGDSFGGEVDDFVSEMESYSHSLESDASSSDDV